MLEKQSEHGKNLQAIIKLALDQKSKHLDLSHSTLGGVKLTDLPESLKELRGLTSLNIVGQNLTRLPSFFEDFKSLASLNLSKNRFIELPESVGHLPKLQTLNLASNNLESIPEFISNLIQLRSLDLSNNQLRSLPRSLSKLPNLVLLHISGNNLGDFSSYSFESSTLKTLSLSSDQLQIFNDVSKDLPGLVSLTISANNFPDFPDFIPKLKKLETLNISGTHLTQLPDSLVNLEQLQSLTISSSRLNEFPEALFRLTNLRSLTLTGGLLKEIPSSIGSLRKIESITLTGNQIEKITKSMGDLAQIKSIIFANNKISSLPAEIFELPKLENLNLGNNAIDSLPDAKCTAVHLSTLDLTNNRISHLSSLGFLKSLKNLYLTNNPLESIPTDIGDLTKLESLTLGNTRIRHLPETISNLSSLQRLSVSNTAITHLPEWIGKLKDLRGLDLSQGDSLALTWSKNQRSWSTQRNRLHPGLESLPLSLSSLPLLEELYLVGNDQLDLPPEILGPRWDDAFKLRSETKNRHELYVKPVLSYYSELQAAKLLHKVEPLNEAKVLVLGQPEAGKSSLIYALTTGYPTPDFSKTDGIARKEWVLEVEDGKISKNFERSEKLRLNLWDFGGQEIYKSTHTFFLTKRAIYLIVSTARKDTSVDADLEEWLETARTFGDGAPVWVVINKHDENPNGGPDEEALLRKYAPILKGFVRTQCQHAKNGASKGTGAGLGIEELRNKIVSEAWTMPEVRQTMTTQAMAIKRSLEEMTEATLTIEQYRSVCCKFGEPNENLQDTLLNLWDKVGTVRYFPEDDQDVPEMRETAILNPEWVTEAVYKVLEDAKLKANNGLVTDADFDRIMKTLNYKTGTYHLIENVMRRFSQLYDTGDGEMFIPQLLSENEPKITWPHYVLRFVYAYPVLPAGLIPSFIAKMHMFHDKDIRPWRKGCVLELQGCHVRVIGDKKLKQIEICVFGEKSAQMRDSLDQVRFKFEELHKAMTGMHSVKELIPIPGVPDAPMLDYRFLRTLEASGVDYQLVPSDFESSGFIKVVLADVLGSVRGQAMKEQDGLSNVNIVKPPSLNVNVTIDNKNMNNTNTGNNYGAMGVNNKVITTSSFNTIQESHGAELAELFAKLSSQIDILRDEMIGKEARKLDDHFNILRSEAEKSQPDKGILAVSAQGLVDAAKTTATLASPAIATLGLILRFFGLP